MLVAVAVGEVEQAAGDESGSAVRRDVAEAYADERPRAVGGEGELGLREAQDLELLVERGRGEAEREPVLDALVGGELLRPSVRAPVAGEQAVLLRAESSAAGSSSGMLLCSMPAAGQLGSATQRPGRSS